MQHLNFLKVNLKSAFVGKSHLNCPIHRRQQPQLWESSKGGTIEIYVATCLWQI